MAASSPRCIQQSLLSETSHILAKPMHSSPLSTATASSFDSELDKPSAFLLHGTSNDLSSLSKPASTQDKLREMHNLSIQLTQAASESFNVHQGSSPVSTPAASPLPHQHSACSPSSHQPWIPALLSTKFYGPCPKHANLRKNDLNLFCTDHALKICQYCNQAHKHSSKGGSCTILHVSRYMYHDVLLAKEAAALLDVSEVQSYLNNGNRVVYIDRRAQPKSKLAPHAKACAVCSRTLQDPYRFCSVFCRLAHAKDPAAASSVPVPDACPLLQQTVRKVKANVPSSPNHAKRTDRSAKRLDRNLTRSPTMSPVTPSRSSARNSLTMAPPLRLTPMNKKSRRKGTPVRSPASHGAMLLLCYGTYMHH